MGKKCLIMYASFTGNTEKVAQRIKETFESRGWQCDMFKVRKNADDILRRLGRYRFNIHAPGLTGEDGDGGLRPIHHLSLIHISEPTRPY